jgi:predicted nucleotide-binding protein
VIREDGIEQTGIFASGVKAAVIPDAAGVEWVKSREFQNHFTGWTRAIAERRDVFLGYCSKANERATRIRASLERAGFTVLDWSRDFRRAGGTILEEIEGASSRCRRAIFLFTADDELDARARAKASFAAVPRDNVLLEAGYFIQARGK